MSTHKQINAHVIKYLPKLGVLVMLYRAQCSWAPSCVTLILHSSE